MRSTLTRPCEVGVEAQDPLETGVAVFRAERLVGTFARVGADEVVEAIAVGSNRFEQVDVDQSLENRFRTVHRAVDEVSGNNSEKVGTVGHTQQWQRFCSFTVEKALTGPEKVHRAGDARPYSGFVRAEAVETACLVLKHGDEVLDRPRRPGRQATTDE